jgi:hypothetical protein
LTGNKEDHMNVMDAGISWQQDEAVVAARAAYDDACKTESRLDEAYRLAWAEAVADFVEGATTAQPEPSDPAWQARRQAAKAGKATQAAKRTP